MPTIVADALDTWRAAERLLETLEPTSPDHETAVRLAAEMRALYRRLTAASTRSSELLNGAGAQIEAARATLARLDGAPS